MKNAKWLAIFAALLLLPLVFASGSWAQDQSSARGNLSGIVYDATKATVPGAQVTITGPIGSLSQTTNDQGAFLFSTLIPGFYTIKVQKAGFKVASIPATEVLINKTTSLEVTLETGEITQTVEVSAAAVTVDTSATAVNNEFSDTFYSKIPIGRSVSGLFYLAPGVTSGIGTGQQNPSISGSSGLENLYVADGVSINDPAFGGIVQLVTKSGGTKFFGTIGGYFNGRWMQDTYQNADDPKFATLNKVGSRLENANYEGDFELGGYVPLAGLKDRLFFFGTFNPSWNHEYFQPAIYSTGQPSGLFNSNPLIDHYIRRYDYAGKLTFKINNSHTVESTVSGDPSYTDPSAFSNLSINNNSGFSKQDYGTRQWATRYDGAFGSSLLVDAAFTWSWNHFNEVAQFPNVYGIQDSTQIANLPGQVGQFIGSGYFNPLEPYDSNTRGLNGDVTKTFHFAGTHSINVGYTWQFPKYFEHQYWPGPKYAIPAMNATGGTNGVSNYTGIPVVGQMTDSQFVLELASAPAVPGGANCTLCPYMSVPGYSTPQQVVLQQVRGRFDGGVTNSEGKYHAGYINDSWEINKYITLNAGVRWEQQRLKGIFTQHAFTNMWSPRAGIVVDPQGNRKQKIYANFGRYAYVLPLDAAIRALGNEEDFQNSFWRPDYTTNLANCPAGTPAGASCVVPNSLGTVSFIGDSDHFLNKAIGGVDGHASAFISGFEPFANGTRMEFTDEFLVGYDREFKGGIVASVRYIDRRLKRVIEDEGGISVEQYNAGDVLLYEIGNPNAKQDIFVNPDEIVFGQGVNIAPAQQIPVSQGGLVPNACYDTNGNPTPYIVFNQQTGLAAVSGGGIAGSACFPAVNTNTWTDASGNLLPDCTSLKQQKTPGACAAFGAEPYGDGNPDTYKDPKREYEAVEFEVRKAFSHNWALSVNYRVAQLKGNYEGAFRNDNGQADPGISSLFDFTEGGLGLLAGQQSIGALSTDRKHVLNAHSTYVLPNGKLKGFTIGAGVTVLSGNPLTSLYAQQAYQNPGEVPLLGRANLGRSPVTGSVDAHLEYPFKLSERMQLKVAYDLFNIVDSTRQTTINQFGDLGFGLQNVDFQKPITTTTFQNQGFVNPFSSRLSVLLTF